MVALRVRILPYLCPETMAKNPYMCSHNKIVVYHVSRWSDANHRISTMNTVKPRKRLRNKFRVLLFVIEISVYADSCDARQHNVNGSKGFLRHFGAVQTVNLFG